MIGEPCAGKPPARFDEGELEIEPARLLRQLSTLLLAAGIDKIGRLPLLGGSSLNVSSDN